MRSRVTWGFIPDSPSVSSGSHYKSKGFYRSAGPQLWSILNTVVKLSLSAFNLLLHKTLLEQHILKISETKVNC